MRSIIIFSLIISFTITNAQYRKDTIRMKDGTFAGTQLPMCADATTLRYAHVSNASREEYYLKA